MTEKASNWLAHRLVSGLPAVKVCRVDTVQGARLTFDADIDFIGLQIVYRLSHEKQERFARIRETIKELKRTCFGRGPSERVLVTRSVNLQAIAQWCSALDFQYIQLHSQNVTPTMVKHLRQLVRGLTGREIGIIKTLILRDPGDIDTCREWRGVVEALLFDSKERGGTGEKANWEIVRRARRSVCELPVFIAGGIKPSEARLALNATNADAVDVQSSCEVRKQRGPKRKKRKHVREVLALSANLRGKSIDSVWKRYIKRRTCFSLLLSVADLNIYTARAAIGDTENLPIDGFQIDTSDGSYVRPWGHGAARWSRITWSLAPEVPIWLHLFSKDLAELKDLTSTVREANPHLIGVFLHCPPTTPPAQWFAGIRHAAELVHDLVLIPSITATQALTISREQRGELDGIRAHVVLVTTPDQLHGIAVRAERTTAALRHLRNTIAGLRGTWRIGIDRAVSFTLLNAMGTTLPDFVVVGRRLVTGSVERNVAGFRNALFTNGTRNRQSD